MLFSLAFGEDNNVIKIYNNKNIEFIHQDPVDVAQKRG